MSHRGYQLDAAISSWTAFLQTPTQASYTRALVSRVVLRLSGHTSVLGTVIQRRPVVL